MKTTDPFRRRNLWLRFVVCLLVALGSLEGTVLCVGAEGHVEVERSKGSCCGALGAAASDTASPSVQSTLEDECGTCVDVPLPHGGPASPSSAHGRPFQTLPFVALLAALHPTFFPQQPPFRFTDRETPPLSPGLSTLRSIILLL